MKKYAWIASAITIALLHAGARADYTITVNKAQNRGTWQGFGASLCWWGNGVGGSSYQNTYADLVFTTRTVRLLGSNVPGLGLNIARYNVGGGGIKGDIPGVPENVPASLPWYKDIDGYWLNWYSTDPASSSWNWFRDSNQRNMMWAARDRGAIIDFFANAPMWWMTNENSSAGGSLQYWNRRDHARYLATVVKYAKDRWGVNVNSIEPFNEPVAGWWNYPTGQEGCNISRGVQAEVLGYLREELDNRGLSGVQIAASDENTMTSGKDTYEFFKGQFVSVNGTSKNVANLVNRVTVHGYNGIEPWRDDPARVALRNSVGTKSLWMSEYGDGEGSGMTLAQSIMADLTYLRPTAWIYWQPIEPYSAWGLVNAAYSRPEDQYSTNRAAPLWIYTKYYVFAQFTRFLRPNMVLYGTNDANSLIAYNGTSRQLTIVTVNYGNPQNIALDLSSLNTVGGTATMTTTVTNGSKLLFPSPMRFMSKRATYRAEANSVTSIVISGVIL
ncbi:MAG: glycoside hydrolase [Fimbriimonas sp.]